MDMQTLKHQTIYKKSGGPFTINSLFLLVN